MVPDWEEAEDSEEEAAKAKRAAELKAKAEAEAAAAKKSKTQRIAIRQAEKAQRREEEEEETSSEEEDEAERRQRLRRTEQASDLKHAEDLFGDIGVPKQRSTAKGVIEGAEPNSTIDLGALPFFNPTTKDQFQRLRDTLAPILAANNKKGPYALFLQDFYKQLAKDLPSEQIKKLASTMTALGNEKMKEEKAADKSGKRSKAQKTKTTLAVGRNATTRADTTSYGDEGFDE